MATPNHLHNIAIVGAGGRSGKHIVEALLRTNQHRITVLTRADSSSEIPANVHHIHQVSYNDHTSLVSALQNQDALVITLSNFAPAETQQKLIDAAVEAGVEWILPNEWGVDLAQEEMGKDVLLAQRLLQIRAYIDQVGKGEVKWVGVACSFWYEFSLGGSPARYGFDFDKKHLTYFDDGKTRINTTTWAQVGRAVAKLLSLKLQPEDGDDAGPCLKQFANQSVYISSFLINQREMLDSVLRVTGDRETEWTISHEDSRRRFQTAEKAFGEGSNEALVVMLYTRVFYPDGSGDFQRKLHNDVLGLPEEDLDAATRVAVRMALAGETNMPGDRKRTV